MLGYGKSNSDSSYSSDDCDSYFAYDHKYDEFAIRIAEGGVIPRHAKPKKSKTTNKTPPAVTLASDQDLISEPPDLLTPGEAKDATTGIEVRRDLLGRCSEHTDLSAQALTDLNADELAVGTREAVAAQEGGGELEESLIDGTFVPDSHLLEPENWMIHSLVVGDPFIPTKVSTSLPVVPYTSHDIPELCRQCFEELYHGI
jgi:hypothetical protein